MALSRLSPGAFRMALSEKTVAPLKTGAADFRAAPYFFRET
jgi:hypothetical protein